MTHPPLAFAPPDIPVRAEWLARMREPILEPGLPIVDAHHHLWDRPGHRYLFEDLLADTRSGHDIRATVYVQCRSMYRASGAASLRAVGETEFANGVAAQSASGCYGPLRACAAIVGFADLMQGDAVAPVLQAHLRAAPERLRGIRCMTASHASAAIAPNSGKVPEGLLMQPAFRRGYAQLAPLGLSYDAWAFHTQLPDVLDLARRFPQTSLIVNHAGGPLGIGPYRNAREEVYAQWKRSLQALSACPNVTIKLGGLAMHFSGLRFHECEQPPGSHALAQAWRPYVETCVELFGPARCMFESNFCVDKGMTTYAVLWNAFKRLTQGCSPQDKFLLFSGTATRVYRLEKTLNMPRPK
jgi:L-fuconolactonase